jgi:hypothetical protein
MFKFLFVFVMGVCCSCQRHIFCCASLRSDDAEYPTCARIGASHTCDAELQTSQQQTSKSANPASHTDARIRAEIGCSASHTCDAPIRSEEIGCSPYSYVVWSSQQQRESLFDLYGNNVALWNWLTYRKNLFERCIKEWLVESRMYYRFAPDRLCCEYNTEHYEKQKQKLLEMDTQYREDLIQARVSYLGDRLVLPLCNSNEKDKNIPLFAYRSRFNSYFNHHIPSEGYIRMLSLAFHNIPMLVLQSVSANIQTNPSLFFTDNSSENKDEDDGSDPIVFCVNHYLSYWEEILEEHEFPRKYENIPKDLYLQDRSDAAFEGMRLQKEFYYDDWLLTLYQRDDNIFLFWKLVTLYTKHWSIYKCWFLECDRRFLKNITFWQYMIEFVTSLSKTKQWYETIKKKAPGFLCYATHLVTWLRTLNERDIASITEHRYALPKLQSWEQLFHVHCPDYVTCTRKYCGMRIPEISIVLVNLCFRAKRIQKNEWWGLSEYQTWFNFIEEYFSTTPIFLFDNYEDAKQARQYSSICTDMCGICSSPKNRFRMLLKQLSYKMDSMPFTYSYVSWLFFNSVDRSSMDQIRSKSSEYNEFFHCNETVRLDNMSAFLYPMKHPCTKLWGSNRLVLDKNSIYAIYEQWKNIFLLWQNWKCVDLVNLALVSSPKTAAANIRNNDDVNDDFVSVCLTGIVKRQLEVEVANLVCQYPPPPSDHMPCDLKIDFSVEQFTDIRAWMFSLQRYPTWQYYHLLSSPKPL